jgi:hypothetical protein
MGSVMLVLMVLLWLPGRSFGQGCEDQLAQTQKQLALTRQSRDQAEERAAALWSAAERQLQKAAQAQKDAEAKKEGANDEKK